MEEKRKNEIVGVYLMNKLWLNWNELDRLLVNNEVVFFGSGEWAEKTLRKINKKPKYILDNNKLMQGTYMNDVELVDPEILDSLEDEYIILITTGSYKSVMKELDSKGYKAANNYYCSPVLYNQKIEYEIKNNEQKILFTCSEVPDTESESSGGGLYKFDFKSGKSTKLLNGKFHEFVMTKNNYFILDEFEGVKLLDKKFNLLETYSGLPGSIMHGLSIDEDNNRLFVGNTGRDSVSILDSETGELIKEIFITKKHEKGDVDKHHLNDLNYYKGDLFISMFSFSGLWREGVYDGGIAKMNLEKEKITHYPKRELWMPHSINFINGEMVFVDSMRGDVYKTNNKKLVNVNGFARGLAYDGKYYYIGQSEHRYFDRLKDISKNIHLNCGIHTYDPVHKASRFYSFENMTNIHTIKIMD